MDKIKITALLIASVSTASAATLTTDYSTWSTSVTGTINSTQNYGPNGTDISSLALVGGGTLDFDNPLNIRTINSGWSTWSGGYTGQVLYAAGQSSISINLSSNLQALGFYAEPNTQSVFDITLQLISGESITQAVDGNGGASFFGFFGGNVSSISVSTTDNDFAFGDFVSSIAQQTGTVPEPAPIALLGSGFLGFYMSRRKGNKA